MIICGLKRILHKKKVIFIQLQESLIPLYLTLLLCNKIYDPPETKILRTKYRRDQHLVIRALGWN